MNLGKQRLANLVIEFDGGKKLFPEGLCVLLLHHTYPRERETVEDSVGIHTCWFKLNSIFLLSELGGPVGEVQKWSPTLQPPTLCTVVTWLILPVVICLSQRLSHACLSINDFVL